MAYAGAGTGAGAGIVPSVDASGHVIDLATFIPGELLQHDGTATAAACHFTTATCCSPHKARRLRLRHQGLDYGESL
ncbi:hypothetical protein ACP70R_013608 [Stipagrostis hirtigluma subsp. patula]